MTRRYSKNAVRLRIIDDSKKSKDIYPVKIFGNLTTAETSHCSVNESHGGKCTIKTS